MNSPNLAARWFRFQSHGWLSVVLLCSSVAVGTVAQAQDATIKSGHGGHWYDPSRDGEGWVLELLENDSALLYWFTYDEDGDQRWLTAVGEIVSDDGGEFIEFPTLVVTRGGHFGPDFDPADVVREAVGDASMRFSGCNSGEFTYAASGHTQTIPIQRLTHTMGTRCESLHGVPGREVTENAGQSGSWFDPSHNGEGYSLQWMSPSAALITWYTYDTEGNQYWMLGVGQLQGDRILFQSMHTTRGARFGTDFDPDDVERIEWGDLSLTLNCDSGLAEYDSVLAPFGTGTLDLARLTRLHEVACPWQKPKLTELYDITLTQIPIAQGTPTDTNFIQAQSITDDGTVVGTVVRDNGHHQVVRFASGATGWEALPNDRFFSPIFVPPDGGFIVASESIPDEPTTPLIWRDSTSWLPLGTTLFRNSIVTGASLDRSRIVGEGRNADEEGNSPWIWDPENGQVQLPVNEQIRGGHPHAASNDGRIVIGASLRSSNNFPRPLAIRWADGEEPEVMYDAYATELGRPLACNADCTLIFGIEQSIFDSQHPHSGEAWYWKAPGVSGYLGQIDEVFDFGIRPYGFGDVTNDGSMAVGDYVTNSFDAEGYIWTQNTGMVSVGRLLDELGLAEPWTVRTAISVSSTGNLILLRGYQDVPGQTLHAQAAVLHLVPKSAE